MKRRITNHLGTVANDTATTTTQLQTQNITTTSIIHIPSSSVTIYLHIFSFPCPSLAGESTPPTGILEIILPEALQFDGRPQGWDNNSYAI